MKILIMIVVACLILRFLVKLRFPPKCFITTDESNWGSSGFAGHRNLKNICRGTRNSSNFSLERRNSPPLPDLSCKKRLCHISVFLASTVKIFPKLWTRILTATLLVFPHGWMKMSSNTNLCHHFDNKVAGRGTLAKNDRNGGF